MASNKKRQRGSQHNTNRNLSNRHKKTRNITKWAAWIIVAIMVISVLAGFFASI